MNREPTAEEIDAARKIVDEHGGGIFADARPALLRQIARALAAHRVAVAGFRDAEIARLRARCEAMGAAMAPFAALARHLSGDSAFPSFMVAAAAILACQPHSLDAAADALTVAREIARLAESDGGDPAVWIDRVPALCEAFDRLDAKVPA